MMRITSAQLWVHDQDEALDFYVDKLGMEVRSDVTVAEMGGFRWLTVSPANQPEVSIVLMKAASPPISDEGTLRQVTDLMGKGYAGTVFLTTDDCFAEYDALSARGVEFVELPEERFYGIDASFRDPSGNHIRLTQLAPVPARVVRRGSLRADCGQASGRPGSPYR